MGVTRIDRLGDDERARLDEWADRWIDIGLRTGPADRERFEAAVRDCYHYASVPSPYRVVWVPSPIVLAIAAPAAAFTITRPLSLDAVRAAVGDAVDRAVYDPIRGAVRVAVNDAVDEVLSAVRGAFFGGVVGDAIDDLVDDVVRDAVQGAVHDAVERAVDDAVWDAACHAVSSVVQEAVDDTVDGAVRGAVGDAIDGAVGDAVDGAVGDAVGRRVLSEIARAWPYDIRGQFGVGRWRRGASYTSFFREVCKLELDGDLWDRGRAHEATAESGCWWWPHLRFVMVSERPLEIHRELVDPARSRGWGSHRLHRDDGPAVVWPDGWGVWSVHGVRVPRQVVESPDSLTVAQISAEQNAEVRRIMVDRFGAERYLREAGATLVDEDVEWGKLWRLEQRDDEPLVMVEVINSTPEPDGTNKTYCLRVPPTMRTARAAVAWTFDVPADDYELEAQT
jgi:hypothetical protein